MVEGVKLGKRAVALRYMRSKDLAKCLKVHDELKQQGIALSLEQVLVEEGYLTKDQIEEIKKQNTNIKQNTNVGRNTSVKKTTPPITSFGRYIILEQIGSGGMGKVYKARDPKLDRVVALKVLHVQNKELDQRFLREAKATAKLKHPNIVTIHDIGNENGQNFFTMDFLEGETLADFLDEKPSIKLIIFVMNKIAQAMDYAHSQGVIHRDLKPVNIMIVNKKEPKVMDFGLAKIIESQANKISYEGMIIGTVQYMSPEQANGDLDKIDESCDVYSLGAILYEMLTGRPPFKGHSLVNLVEKICCQPPKLPSEINKKTPKELEKICLKALSKKKKDRYASAKEFAKDLKNTFRNLKTQKVVLENKPFTKSKRVIYITICIFLFCIFLLFSSTTSSSIELEIKLAGENQKYKNTFLLEEEILVEVNWEMKQREAMIRIYGNNIQFYQFLYDNK